MPTGGRAHSTSLSFLQSWVFRSTVKILVCSILLVSSPAFSKETKWFPCSHYFSYLANIRVLNRNFSRWENNIRSSLQESVESRLKETPEDSLEFVVMERLNSILSHDSAEWLVAEFIQRELNLIDRNIAWESGHGKPAKDYESLVESAADRLLNEYFNSQKELVAGELARRFVEGERKALETPVRKNFRTAWSEVVSHDSLRSILGKTPPTLNLNDPFVQLERALKQEILEDPNHNLNHRVRTLWRDPSTESLLATHILSRFNKKLDKIAAGEAKRLHQGICPHLESIKRHRAKSAPLRQMAEAYGDIPESEFIAQVEGELREVMTSAGSGWTPYHTAQVQRILSITPQERFEAYIAKEGQEIKQEMIEQEIKRRVKKRIKELKKELKKYRPSRSSKIPQATDPIPARELRKAAQEAKDLEQCLGEPIVHLRRALVATPPEKSLKRVPDILGSVSPKNVAEIVLSRPGSKAIWYVNLKTFLTDSRPVVVNKLKAYFNGKQYEATLSKEEAEALAKAIMSRFGRDDGYSTLIHPEIEKARETSERYNFRPSPKSLLQDTVTNLSAPQFIERFILPDLSAREVREIFGERLTQANRVTIDHLQEMAKEKLRKARSKKDLNEQILAAQIDSDLAHSRETDFGWMLITDLHAEMESGNFLLDRLQDFSRYPQRVVDLDSYYQTLVDATEVKKVGKGPAQSANRLAQHLPPDYEARHNTVFFVADGKSEKILLAFGTLTPDIENRFQRFNDFNALYLTSLKTTCTSTACKDVAGSGYRSYSMPATELLGLLEKYGEGHGRGGRGRKDLLFHYSAFSNGKNTLSAQNYLALVAAKFASRNENKTYQIPRISENSKPQTTASTHADTVIVENQHLIHGAVERYDLKHYGDYLRAYRRGELDEILSHSLARQGLQLADYRALLKTELKSSADESGETPQAVISNIESRTNTTEIGQVIIRKNDYHRLWEASLSIPTSYSPIVMAARATEDGRYAVLLRVPRKKFLSVQEEAWLFYLDPVSFNSLVQKSEAKNTEGFAEEGSSATTIPLSLVQDKTGLTRPESLRQNVFGLSASEGLVRPDGIEWHVLPPKTMLKREKKLTLDRDGMEIVDYEPEPQQAKGKAPEIQILDPPKVSSPSDLEGIEFMEGGAP